MQESHKIRDMLAAFWDKVMNDIRFVSLILDSMHVSDESTKLLT